MVHAPSGESPVLIRRSVTWLRCASGMLPIEYLQSHLGGRGIRRSIRVIDKTEKPRANLVLFLHAQA